MLYDLYFMNLWQQISTFCLITVGSTLFCIVLLLLHWMHVHVSYEQIGIFCLDKWIWPDAPKPIKRTKPTTVLSKWRRRQGILSVVDCSSSMLLSTKIWKPGRTILTNLVHLGNFYLNCSKSYGISGTIQNVFIICKK